MDGDASMRNKIQYLKLEEDDILEIVLNYYQEILDNSGSASGLFLGTSGIDLRMISLYGKLGDNLVESYSLSSLDQRLDYNPMDGESSFSVCSKYLDEEKMGKRIQYIKLHESTIINIVLDHYQKKFKEFVRGMMLGGARNNLRIIVVCGKNQKKLEVEDLIQVDLKMDFNGDHAFLRDHPEFTINRNDLIN